MTVHLRWFLVPLAVALLTISVPTGAGHAALILDQVFDPGPNPSVASGISLLQKAQTFTVGLAGTLAQVDVDILRNGSPAGPLLFDVRATTAGGAPIESNATTLASLSIPAATVPTTRGFFSIDVSGFGVAVTPGEILAIVLRGTQVDVDYTWFGGINNPYPAGDEYFRNPPGTWTLVEGNDLGFKTFVTTTPVPSAVVLFGVGVAALAGVTWRRHRRLAARAIANSHSCGVLRRHQL